MLCGCFATAGVGVLLKIVSHGKTIIGSKLQNGVKTLKSEFWRVHHSVGL